MGCFASKAEHTPAAPADEGTTTTIVNKKAPVVHTTTVTDNKPADWDKKDEPKPKSDKPDKVINMQNKVFSGNTVFMLQQLMDLEDQLQLENEVQEDFLPVQNVGLEQLRGIPASAWVPPKIL